MDSQKRENLLNLALDSSMEEREKSLELNIGYQREDNTWEIIVKYHGDLQQALSSFLVKEEGERIKIEELIAGYAILTVPESLLDALSAVEEIEYMEKPKRLFFEVFSGKQASCILSGSELARTLRGKGILVAVIDSGIAYRNEDFQNPDGTTRIRFLWDQTVVAQTAEEAAKWKPPAGFQIGTEFTREQINEALRAPTEAEGFAIVPSVDTSGHGTAVAGIAAGSGRRMANVYESGQGDGRRVADAYEGAQGDGRRVANVYEGVAPESELLIVKLGTPRSDGFPRTTELMRALTYVVKKAIELQMPAAINLSFGNTYGAHDGTSLLERFLDNVSEIGRNVICVGSGNEGASGGHCQGKIEDRASVELLVGNYERGLNVQLWKDYVERYRIEVVSPSGESFVVDTDRAGKQTYQLEQTKILLYNGEPAPYLTNQEIYFDLLPEGEEHYINSGIWTFRLEAIRIVQGFYTFYLPSETVRSRQTRFVRPTPDATLTIPSTASKVITVGAYQPQLEAYADFSGRGYLYQDRLGVRMEGTFMKPDLAAPGVGILAPTREGGYAEVSGTSFAAPFVTGAAALLMQWGIIEGNDRYLYGEKVKAYLRKGAKPIRGEREYPNERVGYGALCVAESLPE